MESCDKYRNMLLNLMLHLNDHKLSPTNFSAQVAPAIQATTVPAIQATTAPTIQSTTVPTIQATPTPEPTPSPTVVPTPPPIQKVKLFVGILSYHDKVDRRKAIRESWTKQLEGDPRNKDFAYKFFFGVVKDKPNVEELTAIVKEEQAKYKDVLIFEDVVEAYRGIAHKTLKIMEWATDNYDAAYVMKIDDDSFLHLPRLMDDLDHRPKEKFYMGLDIGPYFPDRNPGSQWYMPFDEYAQSTGPNLIVGCGYVVSKDAAAHLSKRSKEHVKVLSLEDVNTAVLLAEANIRATANNAAFHNSHQCFSDRTIVTHYVPIEKYVKYYENIKNNRPMCDNKRSLLTEDYSGSCMHIY